MASLGVAIGTADTVINVPSGLTVGSFPAPFTIDSEYILVTGGGSGSQFYSIERGLNGSARAAHALNAALTAGWSTAGVTPTLAQVLAAGADANGLVIGGLADPVLDQDAATKDYVDDAIPATPTLAAVLAAGASPNNQAINGASGAAGSGAALVITNATGGGGGNAQLISGDGAGGNSAGDITIAGGDGDTAGSGGDVDLTGGGGDAGQAHGAALHVVGGNADGTGGDLTMNGGSPEATLGKRGGDVKATLPAGDGAGRHGQFIVLNLPTADPHVVGAFYSVAGTLHISAG